MNATSYMVLEIETLNKRCTFAYNCCRQDNNLPHDSSVEPSSRARMCYHNCLKFHLYSIMKNPEIILREGAKLRFSEVPQMLSQILHKILLIRTILTV